MALPVAAIICIVLACWVVVVLVIFALYQVLKTRGSCDCECAPCGKEGERGGCTECCISLSDTCNCCNPSVNGCLDSICPGKKKISCVDIVLCQCCANEGEESCCVKMFCCCDCNCDCCEDLSCCTCCTDCETLVCCCLEIRLVSQSEKADISAVKYTVNSQQISTKLAVPRLDIQSIKTTQKRITRSSAAKQNMKPPADAISTARSVSTARSTEQSNDTARSVSQVVVNADGRKRTPRTKKQTISSVTEKSDKVVAKYTSGTRDGKDSKTVSRSVSRSRSLPAAPAQKPGHKPDSGSSQHVDSAVKTPRKRKVSGASDLVEVPVKQGSVPLHVCLSPRGHSESDISAAAYQQYNEQLLPVYDGFINNQMSTSDMQIYSNEAVTHNHTGYGNGANPFFGGADMMSGQSLESLVPSGRSLQSMGTSRPLPFPESFACDCTQCSACCQPSELTEDCHCPRCHIRCPDWDCRCPSCECRCPDCVYRCYDCDYRCPDCNCDCSLPRCCSFSCPQSNCCESCCDGEETESDCCTCIPCFLDGWPCCECEDDGRFVCGGPEGYERTSQCCMWCHDWECVFRACDPFNCDCCPKLDCNIIACLSYRPFPYCLDYCGICTVCVMMCGMIVPACKKMWGSLKKCCVRMKKCCVNMKQCCMNMLQLCLFYCCCKDQYDDDSDSCCVENPCWSELDWCKKFFGQVGQHCCCGSCLDRCGSGSDKQSDMSSSISTSISTSISSSTDEGSKSQTEVISQTEVPPCCLMFSWFCFELRKKELEPVQQLSALVRSMSQRGHSMPLMDSDGHVIHPSLVQETITSQPESTTVDTSSAIGYTDSFGGYVAFADYHGPSSQASLGKHQSSSAIGHRKSRHDHTPVRYTKSMHGSRRKELSGQTVPRRLDYEDETILYNETLGQSHTLMTSGSTYMREAVDRTIDFSDTSDDESELENKIKLKLFRDRESECMIKIHANEEQLQTVDKKLKKFKESPLDTSGLDLYYKKLSQSLNRTHDSTVTESRHVGFVDEDIPHVVPKKKQKIFKETQSNALKQKLARDPFGRRKVCKNKVAVAVVDNKTGLTATDDQVPGTSGLERHGEDHGRHVKNQAAFTVNTENTIGVSAVNSLDFENELQENTYEDQQRKKQLKSRTTVPVDKTKNKVANPKNSTMQNKTTEKPSVFVYEDETEQQVQAHRKKRKKHKTDHQGQNKTDQDHHNTDQGQHQTDQGQHKTDQGQQKTDQGQQKAPGQHKTEQGHHKTEQGQHKTEQGQHKTEQGHHKTDQGQQKAPGQHKTGQGQHKTDEGQHTTDEGQHKTDQGKHKTTCQQKTDQGHHKTDQGQDMADQGNAIESSGRKKKKKKKKATEQTLHRPQPLPPIV